MPRPRINGDGRRSRTYCSDSVEHAHKKAVLDRIRQGHDIDESIEYFYGELAHKQLGRKKKINKWIKQTATIRAACSSGRGTHRDLRHLGDAIGILKKVEERIVRWNNALRRGGAPVTRFMLCTHVKDLAIKVGIEATIDSDDDIETGDDSYASDDDSYASGDDSYDSE
ncbi:hypothetical protein F443_02376 [Phytophthora nicotianae P1569]|uniref:Uncharacterized protein n=1 Tax=Phytophthora nicotianae P1569 TaxID=1317065 RepID=V9FV11_PHYNI|nr:hypothetical protein F443_02376 [Phytophthora nicotianae P1569]